MSKHTPGPWEVEIDELAGTIGVFSKTEKTRQGMRFVVLPDGYLSEPDARLIAAAPELLEACKLLAALGKDSIDSDTMFRFGPAYVAALKAIAKAEGSENE